MCKGASVADYFQFMVAYRTRMIQGPYFKAVIDPVKIESFAGPRVYPIPIQVARIHPIGVEHKLAEPGQLFLPPGDRYLTVTSRAATSHGPETLDTLENEIDKIVTQMSTLLQPQMFMEEVYRGTLLSPTKFIINASIRPSELTEVSQPWLQSSLSDIKATLTPGSDLERRYSLMSRFYARSLAYAHSEEHFLLLWTTLEIFPMQATSNIRPLVLKLADILGRTEDDIRQHLHVGLLYGWRGKLVHDGTLPPIRGRAELFRRLELIVHSVIRSMCGLPYNGSLDRYWTDDHEELPRLE
mgnify:FL=1